MMKKQPLFQFIDLVIYFNIIIFIAGGFSSLGENKLLTFKDDNEKIKFWESKIFELETRYDSLTSILKQMTAKEAATAYLNTYLEDCLFLLTICGLSSSWISSN